MILHPTGINFHGKIDLNRFMLNILPKLLCSMTVSMESFALGGNSSTKALHHTVSAENITEKLVKTLISIAGSLNLSVFSSEWNLSTCSRAKRSQLWNDALFFCTRWAEQMWNIAVVPNFCSFCPTYLWNFQLQPSCNYCKGLLPK